MKLDSLLRLARDWRIKVLVPVLAINVAAFGGLFYLMHRYAMENLITAQKLAATVVLDELQINFEDARVGHGTAAVWDRMGAQSQRHRLTALNVYDEQAFPVATKNGTRPADLDIAQAATTIGGRHDSPFRIEMRGGHMILLGTRVLHNGAKCRACHGPVDRTLGALQMGFDISQSVADAGDRVKRNFAIAGAGWLVLLGLMFWTGGVVIGRPVALMKRLAGDDGKKRWQSQDLEAIAGRLHNTIWDTLQAQRQREEDMARQMVRAEQLAALGELAAGLTHEIKNPLAGVMAALELLRSETTEGSENAEVMEQMLSELKRVTSTLDSLLRLAKPQPPQRSDLDLARVVREVASLFSARARRQGVTLDLEISEPMPMLPLDRGLMVQLLVNLLTNSIQATDRGGSVKLMVGPFPRHDGVMLAVSDTGKGISPEHLERIFDPFFTTKEEGTGLGLPICRQIIEQHGGTMTIESEQGMGTRMVVLLPHPDSSSGSPEFPGVPRSGEGPQDERIDDGVLASR